MNKYNQNRGRGKSNFSHQRDNRDSGPRQMFPAVCDNCGRDCEVPFRPSGNRPVLCSDCFESGNDDNGGYNNNSGSNYNRQSYSQKPSFHREERSFERDRGEKRDNSAALLKQLETIDKTLNRILDVLQTQQKVKVVTFPAPGIVEKKEPKEKEAKEKKPRAKAAKKVKAEE